MTVHKSSGGGSAMITKELADDGTIEIDSGKAGFGTIFGGDTGNATIQFSFDTSGNIADMGILGDGAIADTDGKLCVYNNGGIVTIKNRLGSTQNIRYLISSST